MRFSILIPAYNEATSLPSVIQDLQDTLKSMGPYEILIIDDGSIDHTERSVPAGCKVIRHPQNRGHGAAIKTGLREAQADVVVVFDADGQHNSKDIPRLIEKIDQGYDLVVASRTKIHQQRRGWGNIILASFCSLLSGIRMTDITCGLRALKKDKAREFVPLYPNRFCFELTTTMSFAMKRYKLCFIDVEPRIRKGGKSKIRSLADGTRFVVHAIFLTALFRPLKLFFLTTLLLALSVAIILKAYPLMVQILVFMIMSILIMIAIPVIVGAYKKILILRTLKSEAAHLKKA